METLSANWYNSNKVAIVTCSASGCPIVCSVLVAILSYVTEVTNTFLMLLIFFCFIFSRLNLSFKRKTYLLIIPHVTQKSSSIQIDLKTLNLFSLCDKDFKDCRRLINKSGYLYIRILLLCRTHRRFFPPGEIEVAKRESSNKTVHSKFKNWHQNTSSVIIRSPFTFHRPFNHRYLTLHKTYCTVIANLSVLCSAILNQSSGGRTM